MASINQILSSSGRLACDDGAVRRDVLVPVDATVIGDKLGRTRVH